MDTNTGPGLANQAGVRTFARVAVVLLVVGAVLTYQDLSEFSRAADNPWDSSGPAPIALAGIGGLCIILGLVAANVGWMRQPLSFVAGESVPVLKESLDHLAAGPYCRQCGTRNDNRAAFCDSCGTSLA